MEVEIGPVPSESAVAWLDYAEGVLGELESDDRGVPHEAVAMFDKYVHEWRATAAESDTFRWRGDAEPELVEYLTLALYRLGTRLTDEEVTGRREPRPPAAKRFHVVLVRSVLAALERQGESQAQFVDQLRAVWGPATDLD